MNVLAALLFSVASARAGGQGFPIGLFGVDADAPLQAIAEAGFTHVLSTSGGLAPQLAFAGSLKGSGLTPLAYMMAPPTPGDLPPAHPFSHWYIADEPEIYGQTPAQVAEIAGRIRAQDPKTPLTLVVSDGRRAAEYASAADVVMVDWYPVPHLPITSSGDHVEYAVKGSSGKPVWAVVQAMSWRDYPQRNPNKPRIGRFPTLHELRFMTYHALIRGASGIFYFELRKRSSPGRSLLDSPEEWDALREVAYELSRLAPTLAGAPGLREDYGPVETMSWSKRGGTLVLAVNRGKAPVPLPEPFCRPSARPLFERAEKVTALYPACRLPGERALALLLP